jgi:hypothetical protein
LRKKTRGFGVFHCMLQMTRLVRRTAATYTAREALSCRPCTVIAVTLNTVPPCIIAFIYSINVFLSQLFIVSAILDKTKLVHTLKEQDPVSEKTFVIGFFGLYMMEKLINSNAFFPSEAWFSLRGHVNSQNIWYWSEKI